jgi:hypothetical protein
MTEKEAAKIAKDVASTSRQLDALQGHGEMVGRLLAKHPNAAADLLAKLSHSVDKTTRKQVALNPNAGKEVLLALAPQFPLDFFRNPAFDWLLLEDPDLLFNLGKGVLKNILRRPECPESFMQWATKHGSEQEMLAVAMNPAAPHDALQRLGRRRGPVGLVALSHEKLASSSPLPDAVTVLEDEVKSALGEIGADDARTYWKRGLIGAEQWQWLGLKARFEVLYLSDWAYQDDWVAQHADRLASDVDPLVRQLGTRRLSSEQIAANSISTDPIELERLAGSKIPAVLRAVAGNRTSPVTMLENLAGHKSAAIRQCVAGNQDTGLHVLEQLAAAREFMVRAAVASNPATPMALMQTLLKDKFIKVREAAAMALATGMRDAASWHTSAEDLARLALSKKSELRLAVARNPMASESIRHLVFASLITASGPIKQKELAEDPSCPPLLRQQARALVWWRQLNLSAKKPLQPSPSAVLPVDPDITELVELLRQEASLLIVDPAGSLLARVLGIVSGDVMALRGESAETASNARTRALRLMGLRHPKSAPETLAKRSKSIDWAERLAIAGNPACPPNIVSMLKHDAHQLVAQQAHATELLKADDAARKQTIVASSGDELDLGPVVNELSTRLQRQCRSWLLQDTPWWNCLTFAQRVGEPDPSRIGQALQAFPCALSVVARHHDVVVRKSIASLSSTPAATLENLANDPETSVRWTVASNPSTTASTLRILAGDPETSVREAIASNRSTPVSTLAILADDSENLVRKEIASNQSTPIEVLGFLAKDGTWLVRFAIALNTNASVQVLANLSQDEESNVRRAIAIHPALTTNLLNALAQDIDDDTRCAVAENVRTSPQALDLLATDEIERVRAAVARNGVATLDALSVLAHDKCVAVREILATNTQTDQAIIVSLASDKDDAVRQSIAYNSSTTASLLIILSCDQNSGVRKAVASNSRTPVNALRVLAKDKDDWVRAGVARNQSAPLPLLVKLAKDRERNVRCSVAGNRSVPIILLAKLANDSDREVEIAAARNGSNAIEILAASAELDTADVPLRRLLARNTLTPVAALETLAQDLDEQTRANVACNRSTPPTVLSQLAKDGCESVCRAVILNPSTPLPSLGLLARDGSARVRGWLANKSSLPAELLAVLAHDEFDFVRQDVAKNPNTPATLLALLGTDMSDGVRCYVGSNDATPLDVLGLLVNDASSAVRKSVPHPHALSRRQVAAFRLAAQSSAASDESLLSMGSTGYWITRLAAIENPSYPVARHDADLAFTLAAMASDMNGLLCSCDHATVQPIDLLVPLAALDFLPIPSDAKQIAKIAKSSDWVDRARVTLCEGIQPSLLRMLLDDEVEVVKQLAIRRLKEMETASTPCC